MADTAQHTSSTGAGPLKTVIKPVLDLLVALAAWTYFTAGFIILFSPFYLAAFFWAKDREAAFQKYNHLFYKYFFKLIRRITPCLSYSIPEEVRAIRGSVIVGNHLSYLDPILLISLYPRQKTIVKGIFFKVPIFGWMLRQSGYISSVSGSQFGMDMLKQLESLGDYLSAGGNLFIFPEGTRSRDGSIAPFSRGAFKIARRVNAPIEVLRIQNTERLFQPGRFRFHTCVKNTISIERLGIILPGEEGKKLSAEELMIRTRRLMETREPLKPVNQVDHVFGKLHKPGRKKASLENMDEAIRQRMRDEYK